MEGDRSPTPTDSDAGLEGLQNRILVMERQFLLYGAILTVFHGELERAITRMEKLQSDETDMLQEKINIDRRLAHLESVTIQQDILRSRIYAKVQQHESRTYNGTLIWKISDVHYKLSEANQGRQASLHSNVFFTGRFGFKLRACLCLGGITSGGRLQLSLVLDVLQGEYDDLQQWPFRQRITFRLVNQNGGDHVVSSLLPDPLSSQKPTSERNVGYGPVDTVIDPLQDFVVDDTLFINVVVDVSDLKEPLADI